MIQYLKVGVTTDQLRSTSILRVVASPTWTPVCIHPALRTPTLKEAMLDVAETRLTVPYGKEQRTVSVWTNVGDVIRQQLLQRRGYQPARWMEYQRRQPRDRAIPELASPEGYVVRALGDTDELPARSWASWRAFHPNARDQEYSGWA